LYINSISVLYPLNSIQYQEISTICAACGPGELVTADILGVWQIDKSDVPDNGDYYVKDKTSNLGHVVSNEGNCITGSNFAAPYE
jgi:hypothetical protein